MLGETGALEACDCLLVTEKNKVECRRRALPALEEGQVRLRTELSLVSPGTELHHITGTHTKPSTFPRATGYIAVGRVAGLGAGVEGFALGERVLSSLGHHAQGNVEAQNLIRVPEGVEPVEAATTVLLGIALRGVRAGQVRLGDSVAVFGMGMIGLMTAHLAKVAGGFPVIAVDPVARRRAAARELGADLALDPAAGDVKNELLKATGGEGPRVAIDASGTTRVIPALFDAAAEFGRVVVLGGVHGTVPLDLYTRFQKSNLTMVGCGTAYPQDYPFTVKRNSETLLAMIAAGRIRPKSAVTHLVPWRRGPEMYRLLLEKKEEAIGVAFDWSESART